MNNVLIPSTKRDSDTIFYHISKQHVVDGMHINNIKITFFYDYEKQLQIFLYQRQLREDESQRIAMIT